MTILYDAKKRKPRLWIFIAILSIPALLIALFISGSKKTVENHKSAVKAAEAEDIFDRF